MIDVRNKKASLVMFLGTIVNFILFGVKLWIGLASNNISIVTDAINNLGDVLSCMLSLVCFYIILKNDKSEKYPHGFGRLEQISSFVMSLIIIVIGGYFFITSINRLMMATLVLFKWTYFIILLVTVFVKIGLALFYHAQNKKINSDVLKCAVFDSILDASITFMTVIGLLLTKYVQLRLDGIFGIVISTLMITGGLKLFISNLKALIGPALSPTILHEIVSKLEECEEIERITSTRYHDYGPSEKDLIVTATFTNDSGHGILKNACDRIYEKYNIKILFIHEVEK